MGKYPSNLGTCIDLLYKLEQERATFEAKAKAIKSKESALEEHIIETFNKTDIDGARGKRAVASLNPQTVGSVKDWDKFYAYVKKENAWDLLQKRLSSTAYRERLNNKKAVPGVEPFVVNKLSIRKRR